MSARGPEDSGTSGTVSNVTPSVTTVDLTLDPLQAGEVTPARGASTPSERPPWSGWVARGILVLASELDLEPKPAGAEDRRGEAALIKAAQGGSEKALEVLFRRHWPGAHRAAYLIVRDSQAAEDIAQEGFLAAIRGLDRFDRRRPFRPWLHRIVVNRAIDHTRARALRQEVSGAAGVEEIAAEDPPPGFELGPALAELSPEHRAVIVLRYLLDYTPGEIARMLGLRRGTVNSRLRRGLDQLAGPLREQHR